MLKIVAVYHHFIHLFTLYTICVSDYPIITVIVKRPFILYLTSFFNFRCYHISELVDFLDAVQMRKFMRAKTEYHEFTRG